MRKTKKELVQKEGQLWQVTRESVVSKGKVYSTVYTGIFSIDKSFWTFRFKLLFLIQGRRHVYSDVFCKIHAILTKGQLLLHFQSFSHVCYLLKWLVQYNPYAKEAYLGVASSASFIPQADERSSLRTTEIRRALWLEEMDTFIMTPPQAGIRYDGLHLCAPDQMTWGHPNLIIATDLESNCFPSGQLWEEYQGYFCPIKCLHDGNLEYLLSNTRREVDEGQADSGHGRMDLSVQPSFLLSL